MLSIWGGVAAQLDALVGAFKLDESQMRQVHDQTVLSANAPKRLGSF